MKETQILVTIEKYQSWADSRVIAKGLGIQHKNFMETLQAYEKELTELGQLRFETEVGYRKQGGGNPVKYVMLNEDQVIFATQLSRNTPQVVQFKLAITKAFSVAREMIQTLKFAPQADLAGLTPRQVRMVGIAAQIVDAEEAGQPIAYLIDRFIVEAEAMTPQERTWGKAIPVSSVKLLR